MATGHDLTFRMNADVTDFAGNMAKAKREADKLFLDTRTNAERFGAELNKLQQLSALKFVDNSTFNRSYQKLVEKYDPYGGQSNPKMIADAKERTAAILTFERQAAQRRIQIAEMESATIAAIKERHAERVGRALIREAQMEARFGPQTGMRSGGSNSRMMVVQQLAYAAEDASTQLGTRGLSGALMAAGNNLSFAASMAHPAAGAIASVGITAAMLTSTFISINSEMKKHSQELEALTNGYKRLNDVIRERVSWERELSEIKTPAQAENAQKGIDDEIEANRRMQRQALDDMARFAEEKKRLEEKNRRADEENRKRAGSWLQFMGNTVFGNSSNNADDMLKEARAKYEQASQRIADLNKKGQELEEAKKKAAEAEKVAADKRVADQYLDKTKPISQKYTETQDAMWRARKRGDMTPEDYDNSVRQLSRDSFGDPRNQAKKFEDHWKELNKLQKNQMHDDVKSMYQQQLVKDYFGDLEKPYEAYSQRVKDLKTLEKEGALTSEQAARIKRKSFESAYGDIRTPMEKYREEISDIGKAEKEGALTAEQSYRLRRRAASSMAPQTLLGGAYQANSMEAYQVIVAALNTAMREQLIQSFAGTPNKPDDKQNTIAANTGKTAEGINKLVQKLEKSGLNIEVSGLS